MRKRGVLRIQGVLIMILVRWRWLMSIRRCSLSQFAGTSLKTGAGRRLSDAYVKTENIEYFAGTWEAVT
jgi:hypothetical protein